MQHVPKPNWHLEKAEMTRYSVYLDIVLECLCGGEQDPEKLDGLQDF